MLAAIFVRRVRTVVVVATTIPVNAVNVIIAVHAATITRARRKTVTAMAV